VEVEGRKVKLMDGFQKAPDMARKRGTADTIFMFSTLVEFVYG